MNSFYTRLVRSLGGVQRLAAAGFAVTAIAATSVSAQTVSSVSQQGSKLGVMSASRISFPQYAAPGTDIEVSCGAVSGAVSYTWTATTGVLINGRPSPVTTRSPKATLTLGFLPQGQDYFEFCVYASGNNEVSNAACRQVSAVPGDVIAGQLNTERMLNAEQIRSVVYPNPAGSEFTIAANLEKAQQVVMTMTDLTGRVILTSSFEAAAGANNWPVDISAVPQGYYLISLVTADGNRSDLKISVY